MVEAKGYTLNIKDTATGEIETLHFNDAREVRVITFCDDSHIDIKGKLPLKQCRQAIRQFAREQAEKQDSNEVLAVLEQQCPGINPEIILDVIRDLKYEDHWADIRGDNGASRFAFALLTEAFGASVRRLVEWLKRPVTQWQFKPASTSDGVLAWLFRGGKS